ncbi:MAG: homocysteine S-methyltransferase family protein, partial [Victivallales bacterium]|nr:homocysteine S-methyltransferase family protein [Victivallales bacterium]
MTFELRKTLRERLLVFDGAMGTELYARHVFTNRSYDEVCISMPKLVSEIHNDYIKAGADVITTNSFGANSIQLKGYGFSDKVDAINKAAAELARKAAESCDSRKVLVAGSGGPIFRLGSTRESRVASLLEQVRALAPGVDFIIFETLPSRDAAYEASLVMREFGGYKPFVLSFAISDDSERIVSDVTRLFQPFDDCPEPDALGLNCGTGPAHILTALETAVKCTALPIIVQPNAGAPRMVDGRQLYLCSPEYLATYGQRYVNLGARGIGGCCGTTPAHIEELARSLKSFSKAVTHIAVTDTAKNNDVLVPEKPLAERSALGRKLANGEWITMIETT